MKQFKFMRHGAAAAMVLVLAACGGGGSDSGAFIPPAGSPAALTADNDVVAARSMLASSTGLMSNLDWLTGIQATGVHHPLPLVVAQAKAALRRPLAGGEWLVGVTETFTESCTGGGSVSTTLDVANPEALTAGDTFTLTFSNCSEGGASLNGVIRMVFSSISGDLDAYPYTFSATVTTTDLRVTGDGSTLTSNGSMTLTLSSSGDDNEEADVSISSFHVRGSMAGEAYEQTLTNYALRWAIQGQRMTQTVAGTLTDSALGGSLVVATPTSVKQNLAEAYPYEGVLTGTGANNSRVRVTVLSSTTGVRVELDADGNGSYETSEDLGWDEFLGP